MKKKNKQEEENKYYLQMQIEEKKKRDKNENDIEKQYYKPHFGPEETMKHSIKIQEDLVN